MTIFRTLRLAAAVFLASISALALADNFLRDDGTFQPITSSSQSVTATAPITVTPTPCVGSCTIALTVPLTVPQGGTGNVTATAHSLPINEGTGAQANTGTGTTGQCLVSQGSGADPVYKTGCMVFLATLTASNSATIDDQTACSGANCITSTYSDYDLVFENILPATNNTSCEIRVHSASGGAGFKTTGYLGEVVSGISGGTTTTFIPCSQATNVPNTGSGVSGTIRIHNPGSAAQPSIWNGQFVNVTTTAQVNACGGIWNTAAAIDGFQVLFSAGNITSGTVRIYGIL